MDDKYAYIAKLVAKTGFSFLKINILGQLAINFFTAISLIFVIIQSTGNSTFLGGPIHYSGEMAVIQLFSMRPIGTSIVMLSLFICPYLLFTLGSKYLLSKTIHQILNDKGEKILYPLIEKIIDKIKMQNPDLFNKGEDFVKLKLKMLLEVEQSDENKWIKKIVKYGLKKIELSEVDFNNTDNKSTASILNDKIITKLKAISKPSRSFFWIILSVNFLIFILIVTKTI
jgi:hypothetical protein